MIDINRDYRLKCLREKYPLEFKILDFSLDEKNEKLFNDVSVKYLKDLRYLVNVELLVLDDYSFINVLRFIERAMADYLLEEEGITFYPDMMSDDELVFCHMVKELFN